MKIYKHSLTTVSSRSFFIFFIIVLVSLPWNIDFFRRTLNGTFIFIFLFYLVFFAIIFFLVYFYLKSYSFEFGEKCVAVKQKLLWIRRTSYSYYDKKSVTVEYINNFVLDFFNETKLNIINKHGFTCASIILPKDTADEISSSALSYQNTIKTPYIKNEDFFYNKRNLISILFESLFKFFLIYLFFSIVFLSLGIKDVTLFGSSKNIFLYSFLFTFLLCVLYIAIVILHSTNTKIKISKSFLSFSRGRLFRRSALIPLQNIDNYFYVITTFFKSLNIYEMRFKYKKRLYITLPFSKEMTNSLTKEKYSIERENQKSFKWQIYLFYQLIILFISVGLYFLNIPVSILFFLFFTFISLNYSLLNYAKVENGKIIFNKTIILGNYIIMDKMSIKKVKIYKLPFEYYRITLYMERKKVSIISNKKETDALKAVLGYFKIKEV